MVDGDLELPRCRLRQATALVHLGFIGQLGLLFACGADPACEPGLRQLGVRGAEAPRTGSDEDLGSESLELLSGDRDGVGSEQPAARRRAALVVAPMFVGDSHAPRFVRDGHFPWNAGRRATLADVRQIGDVVLLRYALSPRFGRAD